MTEKKIKEVAEKINSSPEILSGLRAYIWDGFALHNVAEFYEIQTGEKPFSDLLGFSWEKAWMEVRNLVHPKVKEIYDKYGEFGKVPNLP